MDVLWEENEEKGEGTGAGKGLGPRVTRKKGFDLDQGVGWFAWKRARS
jgi:hypothetical protein